MNGARVLVDTGAWLAVFHRRDQYHEAAAGFFRHLRDRRAELVVTDLLLAETHLHLVRAVGPARAAQQIEALKSDPLVTEVFADEELQAAAFRDWIRRFADQDFTFADAVSFAVMRARRIRTAFSFDRHFAVAGFRTAPEVAG